MPCPSLSTLLLVILCGSVAFAQTAGTPVVRPQIDNVTGVEAWSFFDPPEPGSDPDYLLGSNRARLGVHVDGKRLSFEGSFQYAQLVGLPDDAIGPGPLGPGALYFFSAGTPQAFQLYFKTMSLTFKDVVPRLSIQAGRMSYDSGQGGPFEGRLIGSADWTPFERSFDGVRGDYVAGAWKAHASFVMPTQGAFEESASPTIGKVQLISASVRGARTEVFAHNYRDTRAVAARPDNTGATAGSVDINVQTVGAALVIPSVKVWGAMQRGRWYDEDHRAFSISAEVGHGWSHVTWEPHVRGGLAYASGDGNPSDSTHGTFFPMVPTTRPDLLGGTYAQMNLRDVYVGFAITPRRNLRLDAAVHQLSLARRLDRWYSGTGATAFDGNYFGFSSRPSTLRTGLGTFMQASLVAAVTPQWTLTGSAGIVRGGDVVRRQFAGNRLWVMAIESALSLP